MEYNLSDQIRMLNDNYLTKVFPYQSLAKAIKLQQQQLIILQSKVNDLLKCEEPSEAETQLLQSYQSNIRQDGLIFTRKFLKQSLITQKQIFDVSYPNALLNLNEQIESKLQALDTNLNNTNAICSLQSSWEVALYAAQSIDNSKLQPFILMARTYAQMEPGKINHILEAIDSKNR